MESSGEREQCGHRSGPALVHRLAVKGVPEKGVSLGGLQRVALRESCGLIAATANKGSNGAKVPSASHRPAVPEGHTNTGWNLP
jgi:hypothetical protein